MIHRTKYIIYLYKSLAERIMKKEIMQLLPKYTYGNNIDEHGNSKTNKPDTFYLNMLQRLIEQFWINMLLFEAYLFITR